MPTLEESPTMLLVEIYCKFYICNNIFPENSFYLSIVFCPLSRKLESIAYIIRLNCGRIKTPTKQK